MPRPAILIVDPETTSREATARAAGSAALVEHCSGLQRGLERLHAASWDLVVLSLDLPAVDMALVGRLISSGVHGGALVLTASQPATEVVIEASRLGVAGIFAVPLDPEELTRILHTVVPPEGDVVPVPPVEPGQEEVVIGAAPPMVSVFRTVGRVSASSATVLILGESGTGKELVARAIHRHSERSGGPFVAINCAAIPENLLESELFGHEKGAFTGAIARKVGRFERASGGTLLLDEIGDMSLAVQSKILRALQEREIERVGGEQRIPVDVRVIAATNKDLRAAIGEGEFREDLYYRLAVVTIEMPRLVEREGDIDLLIQHFVARYSSQYGREIRGVARSVLDRLRAHPWPGNIRELKNVIERAVLLAHGPVLLPEHLPPLQVRPGPDVRSLLPGYAPDLSLAEVERLHIGEVLRAVDGHFGRAAEVLGVHRNTLTRKVREYGLG